MINAAQNEQLFQQNQNEICHLLSFLCKGLQQLAGFATMLNDETIFCGIGNGKRLAYNTMIDNYLINIMAKLKIQKKDWLHSNIKCGGMASVS